MEQCRQRWGNTLRPIRVLAIAACPFPLGRGTPTRILRQVELLAARGHEIHVATYHLGEPLESPGFAVHRIPRVRAYRKIEPGPTIAKLIVLDPLLVFLVRKLLSGQRFDVIHAHHFEGLLVARSAGRRLPIIFDVPTLLESELPYYHFLLPASWKRRLGKTLDRHLPRSADHVIAISDDMRDRLVALEPDLGERISVIASGVELDLFQVGEGRSPTLGAEELVFTGNLAAYQGVELMLEAVGRLAERRPGVRLKIVTLADFEPYRQLADRLGLAGRIDLVNEGFDRVPHHLASAAVALNPRTRCEGVPQKLVNYMAAGCPIVSFSGSAKTLEHRETGLIVEDDDIPAFADAVETLLADRKLACRLGANARLFVERELGWERTVDRLEETYEAVLQDGKQ